MKRKNDSAVNESGRDFHRGASLCRLDCTLRQRQLRLLRAMIDNLGAMLDELRPTVRRKGHVDPVLDHLDDVAVFTDCGKRRVLAIGDTFLERDLPDDIFPVRDGILLAFDETIRGEPANDFMPFLPHRHEKVVSEVRANKRPELGTLHVRGEFLLDSEKCCRRADSRAYLRFTIFHQRFLLFRYGKVPAKILTQHAKVVNKKPQLR